MFRIGSHLAGLIAIVVSVAGASTPVGEKKTSQALGFEVPAGFEVSLYADDALATDIFSMTIDARGRVVVAGKDYVKILHDTDGDGRADKATLFADFPKSGAHGMYFDGNDLICVGDNGVRRLYDTDGDGKCEKVSPPWIRVTQDNGHAANGIIRGPDGWYYLITGNDAGIGREHAASPSSPVKKVNAGALVRISPDGKKSEVVAHGFRNPYDLDFNYLGHVFTVDADGERIYQMPYYAPNRLFDIAQGMHHGWILPGWQRGWSRPPSWPDNVERLIEIGRGSPTGVTAYRHRAFPERYRNGVFSLCWTFGKVYFFPLGRHGSTYQSKKEVFMRTTGDVGFAPTDIAVGPNGDLFVSIGGRGTRGSVFRVHYKGKPPAPQFKDNPLRQVLAAHQPLSSWSRARWAPQAKRLGKKPFLAAVGDRRFPLAERIRAVEVLTELYGAVPIELTTRICAAKSDPELIARVIWALSRTNDSDVARQVFVAGANSVDPRVARAAWEALLALPTPIDVSKHRPNWRAGLNSKDRRVRAAALDAVKGPGRQNFATLLFDSSRPPSSRERLAELWIKSHNGKLQQESNEWVQTCQTILGEEKDASIQLEVVRLLQIGLGDVHTDKKAEKELYGYVARLRDKVDPQVRAVMAASVVRAFPSGDENLDEELARLLAMLREDVHGAAERISGKWTKQSHAKDDIHYLMVLSQLPGRRSPAVTRKTAFALANLHGKLRAQHTAPTDQVPGILEKMLRRLLRHDPKLPAELVADKAFGAPGHELFANLLPRHEKQIAARKIVAAIAKLNDDQAQLAWSTDLVRLVADLPDNESLPLLRKQFDDPRLRDSIALLLAKKRQSQDRERLVEALNSVQPSVTRAAALALAASPSKKAKPADIGKAIRALRRFAVQKTDAETRSVIVKLLGKWTQQKLNPKNAKDVSTEWVTWFTKTYPKEAAALRGLAGANMATWRHRFAGLDWSAGDIRRGKHIFDRKSCFRCHGGARRLGPDLNGVAQRFSREDLFTAIIDPNKDISPTYRPTMIVTNAGKVYSGMVIYQSPALTLLQTTPDTTVRIPQQQLSLVQPGTVSFMPAGLLDDVSDAELVDLYAYLRTLRKRQDSWSADR